MASEGITIIYLVISRSLSRDNNILSMTAD